jgi:bacterioferritin-associated ferredoxin
MTAKPKSARNSERYVCYCNFVPKEKIEAAIRRGCTELNKIFDATNAGVGACGGSCRPYIQRMVDQFAVSGTFPEEARPHKTRPKK